MPLSAARFRHLGLLLALAATTGCSTLSGTGGSSTTIDIVGLPRTTETGATSNRNRIFQRTTPPSPAPAAPVSAPSTGP